MARPVKHPLRRIAIGTNAVAEDSVAALLERETGQTPGIHLDLRTGSVTVSAFVSPSPRAAAALRKCLREGLRALRGFDIDPSPSRISLRVVPARDWAESWKRHFRPIDIDGKLLVRPTWSRRRPKRGQALVELDPGLSFGTGQHATTRFCLVQLTALRRPGMRQTLMDAGTGSGILALAAARLGYDGIEAFDHDPDCVRVSKTNARLNSIAGIRFAEGDATRLPKRPKARFDVVCANLMHDVLVAAKEGLAAQVAAGGTLVVAGILTTQFRDVETAYRSIGWEVVATTTEGEWCSGAFRRIQPGNPDAKNHSARTLPQKAG
jgi:ribosomal protein L11 methyltransferase